MRWLLAAFLAVLLPSTAFAAYQPAGTAVLYNSSGQVIGTIIPGTPTIPLVTTPAPAFAPVPAPQPITRWGRFLDAIGRVQTYITDGVYNLTLAPPNLGPSKGQASLVVAPSPNPSLQCPLTAPVNQTGNTTVITNPGNLRSIHVCGVLLISATQQGITVAEGTGTTCGTNPIYWDGGSGGTAQVVANGGFAALSDRIIYPMQAAGDNVCVLQSGAGNVSGHINYGFFP